MNRVLLLIAQVIDVSVSQLSAETVRDDVETWDSLAIINLAVALESEFGVSLTAEDVERLVSVKSILEVLLRHGVVTAS